MGSRKWAVRLVPSDRLVHGSDAEIIIKNKKSPWIKNEKYDYKNKCLKKPQVKTLLLKEDRIKTLKEENLPLCI